MKNSFHIAIISICIFAFFGNVNGQTRTSITSGNWTTASTWDCNCVPANGDDIVIANGTNILMTGNETMNNLNVVSGGTLDNGGRDVILTGNLHLDGNMDGNGDVMLNGTGTTISGGGYIARARNLFVNNGNQIILAGTNLTLAKAKFVVNGSYIIVNQGEITIDGDIDGNNNLSWIQDINSVLNLGKDVKKGTITASASGNTVNYYKSKNQNIEVPVGASYYNLTAGGGQTKKILGPITIKGDLQIENAILDPNGSDLNIEGNWTNNYGTFLEGTDIVSFTSSNDQTIGGATANSFYDVVVIKPSGNLIIDVEEVVLNTLTMTSGNIDVGFNTLSLGTDLLNPGTFNHIGGTIVGKFERWLLNTGVAYHFPVGTRSNPRDANITFNNLVPGTVTLEFIESFPSNNGLPLLDGADSIFNTYSEGYWSLVANNGLVSTDYNINLSGNGFTSYSMDGSTRVLTRVNESGAWINDGSHLNAIGTVAYRDNASILDVQFAFADTNSCYGTPLPLSVTGSNSVCTSVSGEAYFVTNTLGSTYTWTITGGTQVSGGTTNSITVDWEAIGQEGSVTVQEFTGCAYGEPSSMIVNVHTIAPSSISGANSAAQNTSGYEYSITGFAGYTYNWSITGGTIDSGDGTETVSVTWGSAGTGEISVEASSGCGLSAPKTMYVKIYETINSIASGNWSDASIWDCSCVPGISNNLVVNSPHIVTLTGNTKMNHLLIESGGTFDDGGNRPQIFGNLTVNGVYTGSGRAELKGTNIYLDGTGSFTGHTGELSFKDGVKTISSTAVLDKPLGFVSVQKSTLVINQGIFSASGDITGNNGTSTWVQDVNSILYVGSSVMSIGVLVADANENTVDYNGVSDQNITTAKGNQYYNLALSGAGNKTLQNVIDIEGSVNTSSTFNSGGFDINLAGDWTNTGTYTHGSNLVTFDGTIEQNIYNTIGESYFNTTINFGSTVNVPATSIVAMTNTFTNSGTLNNDGLTSFSLGYANQSGILKGNGTHELNGGNWINNGNFQYDSSTVLFSSGAAQTLQGVTTFYNLTSNNTGGVSVSADMQSIKNTMTASAGTFNTNNLLTLVSDATLTGRIAEIPGGADVTGNVIVNRYIAPAPTSWRFFSTACTGQTLADWEDDVIMAGFPGCAFPTFPFISVYRYDETQLGSKDTAVAFIAPTNITDPILTDEAYWVYVGPVPLTFAVNGPINKFSQSLKVTYTNTGSVIDDGWCLVSNPYPSEIDWDAPGWTKTNVNDAIYVWNPSNQQYASYIAGAGTNGGSQYIPSQQGFYVQTNAAAPALGITESAKAFGNPEYFKSNANYIVDNYIKLDVQGNNQIDEIVIRFDSNATSSFDKDFDAKKFRSFEPGIVSLSSVSDTLDYSINTFPELNDDIAIPLRVLVGTSGNYTISSNDITGMQLSSCFLLEDLFTGAITDLKVDSSYSFIASDTTIVSRFLLHVGAPIRKSKKDVLCFNGSDGQVIAKGNSSGPWNYKWYDINNNLLKTTINSFEEDSLNNVIAGVYKVLVGGNTGVCVSQYDTVLISQPSLLTIETKVDNISCFGLIDGAVQTNVAGGVVPYVYDWSNGESTTFLNEMEAGNYVVSVLDKNNCEVRDTILVSEPSQMTSTLSVIKPSNNGSDGAIVLNIEGGTPNYSYSWGSNEGNTLSLNNISSGLYTFTVIDQNGCKISDSIVLTSAFIDEVSMDGIGLYPNPAINETTISFNVDSKQDFKIIVYNVLGKILSEKSVYQFEGQYSGKINVSNFSSGVYVIEIQFSDGKIRSEKLTVK